MNEAMVVEQNDESREEQDFVELGEVSEETKGTLVGFFFDGGIGRYSGS